MVNKVSSLYFILALICITKLGFEEFKSECPVMEFKESKLIGPQSKSFKNINVDVEFPGTEYVDFRSRDLPVLPAEHAEAVDLWGIIKAAETFPLTDNFEYTVKGIDTNVFCSSLLYGQNERLARRVNNMATVLTLLYHILDAGFFRVNNQSTNHIELAEKMAPLIQEIGEDELFKFRKDSYYDAVSFHQFISQGLIVYMETCSRNSIPFHDKLDKNGFGKVKHKCKTTPNSSSLNALTNAIKIDAETLILSFMLSYYPNLGEKNELNSTSLRNLLKQIIPTPGTFIKKLYAELLEQKLLNPVVKNAQYKRRWTIADYWPTEQNRKLVKKIYLDTPYEAYYNMSTRFSNLQDHLPTLQTYYENVIAHNANSILVRMGLKTFTQYCMGNITWKEATQSKKLSAIFSCCEFLSNIELLNLKLTCSFFYKKIVIEHDDGDIEMGSR